jgi:hypothetical protein
MKCRVGIGEQSLIHYNWVCAYSDGIFVLAEGLDMTRPRALATGKRMISSGNLSYAKRTLVGWMSGN